MVTNKKTKRILTMILSAVIVAAMTVPAFAAQAAGNPPIEGAPEGPGGLIATQPNHEGTKVTEATWATLADNVLEFSEINDRIRYFNPTITSKTKLIDDAVEELDDQKDELDDSVDTLKKKIETAIAISPDPEHDPTVLYLKGLLAQAETGRKQIRNALKKLELEKTPNQILLNQGINQMARGVESLIIGYKTLLTQKELLNKVAEMNKEIYNTTLAMASVGLASQMDVNKAQADMLSSQSTLSSLAGTEVQLYNQIKVLCGWKNSDMPVLGEVPPADLNRMAAYNPETDYIYAAGNNSGVSSVRSAKTSGVKSGELRASSEAQSTDLIRAKLQTAYADILAAKQAYDSAAAGYQSAQLTKKQSEVSYQLGMMSKPQYLGALVGAAQKEAEFKSADLSLTQAMNAYEGAVDGSITID